MSILSLKNSTYRYEKTQNKVLNEVSADFYLGKVYGILGKKAAGKTTLFSLIKGLDDVREGIICFDGYDLKTIDKNDYRAQKIGSICQKNQLLEDLSAVENLAFCLNAAKQKKSQEFIYAQLKTMGIDKKTAHQKVRKLSLNELQKVYLVKVLINEPAILLIEEPKQTLSTLSLDSVMQKLSEYVKNENKCLIISSQSNEIARYVDELWGLNGGKLSFIKEKEANITLSKNLANGSWF